MFTTTKPSTQSYFTPPSLPRRKADQLRRDRRTAIVVMAIMIALMGLVLWLASLIGSPVEPVDYPPIMM